MQFGMVGGLPAGSYNFQVSSKSAERLPSLRGRNLADLKSYTTACTVTYEIYNIFFTRRDQNGIFCFTL